MLGLKKNFVKKQIANKWSASMQVVKGGARFRSQLAVV
jgi:hypothetical protein